VVIAIIGILAAIVLVSLSSARVKGRDARRVSDMHQIVNALNIYMAQNGNYPIVEVTECDTITNGSWIPGLSNLPKDPQKSTSACIIPYNTSGATNIAYPSTGYYYFSPTPGSRFYLMTRLEDSTNPYTVENSRSKSCGNKVYVDPAPGGEQYHVRTYVVQTCN
jgi:type II secretory pathway pseudopilin PulG